MHVCAKTTSSRARSDVGIATLDISPGTLFDTAVSAALEAGVSLVPILQAGDWARVSTPASHYFSTYITILDLHQNSIQQAALSLSG